MKKLIIFLFIPLVSFGQFTIDKYESIFGAITTVYKPRIEYKLYFTTSGYKTSEEENFDILGEYWLYQLNNNLGSDEFGNVAFERGVGKYINHARNKLNATILNFWSFK